MCDLERPVMYGALLGIRNRLGHENFPLIDQYYYSTHGEMRFLICIVARVVLRSRSNVSVCAFVLGCRSDSRLRFRLLSKSHTCTPDMVKFFISFVRLFARLLLTAAVCCAVA